MGSNTKSLSLMHLQWLIPLTSTCHSRKSYLQVTSQRLARGKLVHLYGWRSLALPSVGPVALTSSFQLRIAYRLKHWILDFLRFEMEALADPRWKATMNEEMKSLQKNETWELVECPPGKKPVGCRWIYTVKYKADGSIKRFKARLVAKWYTQTYGIDYTETFAPIAKINTIRVLLSLAANLDWPLQQFDVKNVFLHGELSEEVYMDLPPGCMVSEKQCQKVCKLKKSLYGLKQSPRAWFGRFTKSMRAFGYRQSNSDHTLFLKKQHGKITALIVYVDDMVVTGNDPEERKALQNYLFRKFEMKDLGGNLVTWKSKKQNVVARSSAEAEFRAACDIAHNPVQHDRTKHVEVDRFFIKEKLDDKIVELPKIQSETNWPISSPKLSQVKCSQNFRQVGHV
ncbi:Retrovirus-related Pol polyprotein from transposon RE1 [Vitis vinifera]|uniref:Retrovirus-related Pol polyprotein from transposon RE1 n=1 Tax=Vitis vinifera TaxID=29760 RepID=A0A438EZC2_VITVI|nr:Retrovirus-related Pol polyprotein from transposon RE1 [Vitis vinifera]